jgi:hypothetical protein
MIQDSSRGPADERTASRIGRAGLFQDHEQPPPDRPCG